VEGPYRDAERLRCLRLHKAPDEPRLPEVVAHGAELAWMPERGRGRSGKAQVAKGQCRI